MYGKSILFTMFTNAVGIQAITHFRSDNGKQFANYDLPQFGTTPEPCGPQKQHQDGVSERITHTLTGLIKGMTHASKTPETQLWPRVAQTTKYVHNRSLFNIKHSAFRHTALPLGFAAIRLRTYTVPTAHNILTLEVGPHILRNIDDDALNS